MDEIALENSPYEISGQILSLLPVVQSYNEEGMPSRVTWLWNTLFVALESAGSKSRSKQTPTVKLQHLSFAVNGSLVYPLAANQFSSIVTEGSRYEELVADGGISKTWMIEQAVLCEIKDALVQRIHNTDDLRSKLPIFGQVREGHFPYALRQGNFIHRLSVSSTYVFPRYIIAD
jgi:hypothetical protein